MDELGNPNQNARDRMGRYHRTPEAVARDAEAARLYYEEKLTYRQIAKHFGWRDHTSAMDAVNRALRDVAAPARGARDRRDNELQFLWDSAMEILNNHHVVVSNGQVVRIDGVPIPDDSPKLQAIEQLRKVNESRRKLDGTDAPSRVSVDAEQLGREISRLLDDTLGPDDTNDTDADA